MKNNQLVPLTISIAALTGLALFPSGVVYAQSNTQQIPTPGLETPGLEKARIRFKVPTKLDAALSEVRGRGVKVEYIQREYVTGDQTYTSELYVGGNEELDATAITNEYWKSYEAMLQDLQNEPETPNSAPEKDPKAIEVEAASRRNVEQRVQNSLSARGCWKKNTCPQLVIRGMQVSGDATDITKLRESPQIDKLEIRSQAQQKLPLEQSPPQSFQNSTNTRISSLFSQSNSSLLASNNLSSSLLFGLPKSVAKYEIA